MNRSKSTVAVAHDTDTASRWVNGQVSSADYFAKVRKTAAYRAIGGRLLCKVQETLTRLLVRPQP